MAEQAWADRGRAMADEAAVTASWTIKAVPVDVRKRAVACAAKQGQTMAEWLARAVATQANLEAGDRILPPLVPGLDAAPRHLPPGDRFAMPAESLPAPREHPAAAAAPVVGGMAELAELMRVTVEVGRAGGVAVPKTVARQAFALVGEQLRAARGLPLRPRRTLACASARRLPGGQTAPRNGQTVVTPQGVPSHDGEVASSASPRLRHTAQ